MTRLVDVDSLQKLFNEISSALLSNPVLSKDVEHMVRAFLMVSEMISDAPTVDAEPVVRCKDCKWGVDYYHEGDCYCLHPKWGLTYFDGSWKFYCADGERREDETN